MLLTQPPLGARDVAVIALAPAVSEELLFRGALVGTLGPSPASICAVAAIFGALHVSGGRNYASGAFATAVGVLYGYVYVVTGSVWAAALSHSTGNLTSAAAWLAQQPAGWVSADSSVDDGDVPPRSV